MTIQDRRNRWHSIGERRVSNDRRAGIDSDYQGPERRIGQDRRILLDRRRHD